MTNPTHSTLLAKIVMLGVVLVSTALHTTLVSAQNKSSSLSDFVIARFGMPPSIPDGELSTEVQNALEVAFDENQISGDWGPEQSESIKIIAASEDPRLAWLVSDLMRFAGQGALAELLTDAAAELLDIDIEGLRSWGVTTDHLIAWDIPEPPDYLRYKSAIFTTLVPGWKEIFTDGEIDWRHVSWGGVLIDDRPYNTTDEPCNCIPAADNPKVTDVAGGNWIDDDDVVFGVEVNGEYRAYPRQIMEVREMVNDTLGGRDLGIPYCTLCGAAQAYYTDDVPEGVERPILRTSGLLIRSNKVMYDIVTNSVFDTFRGNAVTGPLAKKQVQLTQASVVTTDWGTWKKEHPTTTVLAESLALGRDFDFRNNRDSNGPIFPVGDVDPRLSVHEDIVGVITESGTPVAFQRSEVILQLTQGGKVAFENIRMILDSGGVKAVDATGKDLGSHQAFWFAWSQFYPATKLWPLIE